MPYVKWAYETFLNAQFCSPSFHENVTFVVLNDKRQKEDLLRIKIILSFIQFFLSKATKLILFVFWRQIIAQLWVILWFSRSILIVNWASHCRSFTYIIHHHDETKKHHRVRRESSLNRVWNSIFMARSINFMTFHNTKTSHPQHL